MLDCPRAVCQLQMFEDLPLLHFNSPGSVAMAALGAICGDINDPARQSFLEVGGAAAVLRVLRKSSPATITITDCVIGRILRWEDPDGKVTRRQLAEDFLRSGGWRVPLRPAHCTLRDILFSFCEMRGAAAVLRVLRDSLVFRDSRC